MQCGSRESEQRGKNREKEKEGEMENENDSSLLEQVPPPNPKGGWRAIKYILGNESFEKLASMSLIANITVYLNTRYNLSGIFVVNVVNIWNGTSNVVTLAGAFVSDAYLGRFSTLLVGSMSSLLGMGAMTLTASIDKLRPSTCKDPQHCPQPQPWQLVFLYIALLLLSLGAGCIRPCNIAFGADQFDTRTAKGRAQLQSFFNWWYFSFTLALVVALTGVVYIQTNISWVIGFVIPTACLASSITIFLVGRHTYIYLKPQGSIFLDIAKVITAACRKSRVKVSLASEHSFYDPPLNNASDQSYMILKLPHTNRFRFLDRAAIITNPNELDNQGKPRSSWRLCSLQQVEQLKCLVAILPVWVTAIGTFMCMDQHNTFGVLQILQTDRSIGPHFKFAPGWMNIIAMLALATWIFIYEQIYLPLTQRRSGRDKRLTMQQRINTGIVLSILSMLVSGIVEEHRRKTALKHGSFISPVSFGLLLPQFVLSGLTEAFAAVSIMEFFTMQMPESMRTIAGAVFFLSLSVSSYLGSLIVNIVSKATQKKGETPWLGGHDLNKNKLDYYYYIIAGLGVVNLAYFNFFARHYVTVGRFGKGRMEMQPENPSGSRDLVEHESTDEEKGLGTHA
ncbi:protein NRT1/ PTR FAMILY 2.8-like [Malus sylvestris]|uniref:protein NRT1/ PTR FAMILY 2.8-like n=1 Tax=Malus sylvestris TaxID=3752 RepID=UPI0021AC32D1|nr:protein NRT1/ PTR FAMILY 2.8-like [Malus sylvestris]